MRFETIVSLGDSSSHFGSRHQSSSNWGVVLLSYCEHSPFSGTQDLGSLYFHLVAGVSFCQVCDQPVGRSWEGNLQGPMSDYVWVFEKGVLTVSGSCSYSILNCLTAKPFSDCVFEAFVSKSVTPFSQFFSRILYFCSKISKPWNSFCSSEVVNFWFLSNSCFWKTFSRWRCRFYNYNEGILKGWRFSSNSINCLFVMAISEASSDMRVF